MTTYHVTKRFKHSYDSEVVAKGLTREKAIAMVEEDVRDNRDATEFMLTFDED